MAEVERTTEVDEAAVNLIATLDALMLQAEPWHAWDQLASWVPPHTHYRADIVVCSACELGGEGS